MESCAKHYEDNGNTHARSLVEFFRNAEEGANAEKLAQHYVVHEYCRDKYQYVCHNIYFLGDVTSLACLLSQSNNPML